MAAGAAAASFETLLIGIKEHMDNEEYDQVVPMCKRAIKVRPESQETMRCKIFALLNLSRWGDAVQACSQYPEESEVAFERAYCKYQLRKYQDALDLQAKLGSDDSRWRRLEAQVKFRQGDYAACASLLKSICKEEEDSGNAEVVLALSQLYRKMNQNDEAVKVLAEAPPEVGSDPRIVEALIALQKNGDEIKKTFRNAFEYWGGLGSSGEEMLASVLSIASKKAAEMKDDAFAAEVCKLYLSSIDGSDEDMLINLVGALLKTDVEDAEDYAQRLEVPAFDHFDPEELEKVAIPKMSVLRKGEAAGEEQEKKKKKKKKKPRYPKGFDPENPGPPPDPERWLPKRERSEYKKKMRKRDKHLLRGPQGAAVNDDSAFRAKGPSTAQIEVSSDRPKARSQKKGKK